MCWISFKQKRLEYKLKIKIINNLWQTCWITLVAFWCNKSTNRLVFNVLLVFKHIRLIYNDEKRIQPLHTKPVLIRLNENFTHNLLYICNAIWKRSISQKTYLCIVEKKAFSFFTFITKYLPCSAGIDAFVYSMSS